MSEIYFNKEDNYYYFNCPHCNVMCQVHKTDIRCTIFRHAVYKENLNFVNPHASKEKCEEWVKKKLVYGCGKPFIFDGNQVKICGYI